MRFLFCVLELSGWNLGWSTLQIILFKFYFILPYKLLNIASYDRPLALKLKIHISLVYLKEKDCQSMEWINLACEHINIHTVLQRRKPTFEY